VPALSVRPALPGLRALCQLSASSRPASARPLLSLCQLPASPLPALCHYYSVSCLLELFYRTIDEHQHGSDEHQHGDRTIDEHQHGAHSQTPALSGTQSTRRSCSSSPFINRSWPRSPAAPDVPEPFSKVGGRSSRSVSSDRICMTQPRRQHQETRERFFSFVL
jgi:hypothetical protein